MGRRKLDDERGYQTQRINLWIDKETEDKLLWLMYSTKERNINNLVRKAIEEFINKGETK